MHKMRLSVVAVRLVHVFVVVCAVLPPLLGSPIPILVTHIALMCNIMVHAWFSDDTCVLGLIESQLRRCSYDKTVTAHAFAPVLSSPRVFYLVCLALLLVSVARIILHLRGRQHQADDKRPEI